jgi:hypothetical protein
LIMIVFGADPLRGTSGPMARHVYVWINVPELYNCTNTHTHTRQDCQKLSQGKEELVGSRVEREQENGKWMELKKCDAGTMHRLRSRIPRDAGDLGILTTFWLSVTRQLCCLFFISTHIHTQVHYYNQGNMTSHIEVGCWSYTMYS